jgi:hypothetical protein
MSRPAWQKGSVCMSEDTGEEFLTKDQARLTRIASIANILAWIVLFIEILNVGATFLSAQQSYNLITQYSGQNIDFITALKNDPWQYAGLAVKELSVLFSGIVFWLVLKGISLGLNMIVEIDLDVQENIAEARNE